MHITVFFIDEKQNKLLRTDKAPPVHEHKGKLFFQINKKIF